MNRVLARFDNEIKKGRKEVLVKTKDLELIIHHFYRLDEEVRNSKTKCHWKKKMTMFGYNNWLSGCRIEVGFNPTSMKYCPYCGKEIEFLEGTITI